MLSDYGVGSNADVTLTWKRGAGDEYPDFFTIKISPGWDVNDGINVPNGDTVAVGFGKVAYFGSETPFTVSLTNVTPCGSKACWRNNYDVFPANTTVVEGAKATGHSAITDPLLSGLDTPTEVSLTVFGQTLSGTPILTNPDVPGSYTWQLESQSQSGVVTLAESTVTIGPPPVGGIVDLRSDQSDGSAGAPYIALASAAAAAIALAAGAWYARRRWAR